MSAGLYLSTGVDAGIRAAIAASVARVAEMKTHLYRRFFTTKAVFSENSEIVTAEGQRVRAAMIYRTSNSVKDIRTEKGGRRRADSRSYDYEILLYIGMKDTENTEQILGEIADALLRELESDTFVEALVAMNCLPDPASVPTMGHALWFDVLCNQAQMRLTVTEYY